MQIICYRCGGGENPENTMLAIEHCQKVHPEWPIEMDVNLTKDNQIILFHDANTQRVTGKDHLIEDLSMRDLEGLNAGYNFQRGGEYIHRDKQVSIPLLQDVLENFPKARLVLDIHTTRTEIVALIIAMVERCNFDNQVIIVSEYDEIIKKFKAQRPDWKYAAATKEAKRLIYSSFIYFDALFSLQSDYLMIPKHYGEIKVLTPRIKNHVHSRNKQLWSWMYEGETVRTVETLTQAKELTDLGVHGVFTDFPAKLKQEIDLIEPS